MNKAIKQRLTGYRIQRENYVQLEDRAHRLGLSDPNYLPYSERPENKDKINAWKSSQKTKAAQRAWRANDKQTNPHKYKARRQLAMAVRRGDVIKPDACSVCDKETVKLHGHHEDYFKPIDVIWCCVQCHRSIHSQIKRDEQK